MRGKAVSQGVPPAATKVLERLRETTSVSGRHHPKSPDSFFTSSNSHQPWFFS